MAALSIIADPACPDASLFAWSTVWHKAGHGDFAEAKTSGEPGFGGLSSAHPLESEVVACLFTDRRCPDDHPLAHLADGDLRGYWGDALAALSGEPQRSSLLWLLERATATEANRRWAEVFALEALAPLVTAGVAVRAEASAALLPAKNGVDLAVALIGQDGRAKFKGQYSILWGAQHV